MTATLCSDVSVCVYVRIHVCVVCTEDIRGQQLLSLHNMDCTSLQIARYSILQYHSEQYGIIQHSTGLCLWFLKK